MSDFDNDGYVRSVTFLEQDRDSSLSPVRTSHEKTGILRQQKRTQKEVEREKGKERENTERKYRTRSQSRRT